MQRSIVRSLLVALASLCGVAAPAALAATDAAQVLQLAQDALRLLRSATYEADYVGVGRFAIWRVMSGRVILSKLEPGNSMRAKLAVQGVQVRPGKVEPVPFHVAFDGVTSRWVEHSSRVVLEESFPPDTAKATDWARVTGHLGRAGYFLVLWELLDLDALAREIQAPVLEYEGRVGVHGVLCHVVYAEYEVQAGERARVVRRRWFIGVEDHFPRKVETTVSR